jgi:2-methylcitrate dehydratase PrpD
VLISDIAARIAGFSAEDCVPLALETARLAILDTIGVTLAGSRTEVARTVLRTVQASGTPLVDHGGGGATLFGHHGGCDLLNAALVNGTAAHALDFDDCSNTLGGHPSAPILPALWALAETRRASGQQILTAYAVGVEVETKIGRAVNFHHYEKGWHPTATLGTFGSAAACARLLDLDAERIAAALALAASMASGLKANFGTMAKPFHVGHCARNGLLAALLAAEGMTASPEALEHPQGFLAVYNGPGTFDAGRILDSWAAPLDLIEPGIAFKRHPCCASTHPAVDALLALRAAHGLGPHNVARIESWTHPRRLRHTNRPDPQSGLDGKFSVQYVLARALAQGVVGIGDFTDAAIQDLAIRQIMTRIHAAPHPDARMDTDEHFFALVRVTTVSGEVFERFVDRPLGRDRAHPLPEGALEAKFRDCARQVQDAPSTEAILGSVLALESVDDISKISQIMVAGLLPDERLPAGRKPPVRLTA